MKCLKSIIVWLWKRAAEVYYRALHASHVFSKRFFSLSVLGHIDLEPNFGFNEDRAVSRGKAAPDGCYYSLINVLDWADVSISVKQAIRNYDSVIRMYLGDGYLINEPRIWRNYSLPAEYRNLELFSQHWHYDQVFDFRNIQLFVLLDDVTEDDGPFEYVSNPDEQNILPSVIDRNNKDIGLKTRKLTGKRGDTLLFSTGSTPHRAGIPAEGRYRDLFSIAFFPAYTKIGRCSTQLLGQPD